MPRKLVCGDDALHKNGKPSYLVKNGDYITVLCCLKKESIRSERDSYVDTRQTEEQRNIRLSWVCHVISFVLHRAILRSDRSTLFVSNLPYTATSTDLNTLFSDIAPVRSAFVVLEHGTGASKGVGYVSFAIPEDAKAAFDSISADGIALDGRKLRLEWATNKVC
jgi:hypothetical protein